MRLLDERQTELLLALVKELLERKRKEAEEERKEAERK